MTSDVASPSLVPCRPAPCKIPRRWYEFFCIAVFYCCWERGGMAWVAPGLSALKLLQLLGCWQREPREGAN